VLPGFFTIENSESTIAAYANVVIDPDVPFALFKQRYRLHLDIRLHKGIIWMDIDIFGEPSGFYARQIGILSWRSDNSSA
jgi:hypothetical protein